MKHVRILRAWLPEGLDIGNLGRGSHPLTVVFIETGEPLRSVDGRRIVIPSSPSDSRAMANLQAEIRRALAGRDRS